MSITLESFAMVVKAMRQDQKDFFRTRDSYYMQRAKAYEKEVDQVIEEILNPKPTQGELEL